MDDNNNINYIEEYLKYGNNKNGNSSFLEYSEPSLIKELITMKIKELKNKNLIIIKTKIIKMKKM